MTTAGHADSIGIYSNGGAPVAPVIDLNSVISRYLSVKRQCLFRIIIKMFIVFYEICNKRTQNLLSIKNTSIILYRAFFGLLRCEKGSSDSSNSDFIDPDIIEIFVK